MTGAGAARRGPGGPRRGSGPGRRSPRRRAGGPAAARRPRARPPACPRSAHGALAMRFPPCLQRHGHAADGATWAGGPSPPAPLITHAHSVGLPSPCSSHSGHFTNPPPSKMRAARYPFGAWLCTRFTAAWRGRREQRSCRIVVCEG